MKPGPNLLKFCPTSYCESYVVEYTAVSQNTFGATWWTDGSVDGSMYRRYPDIVKCSSCNTLYRLSEQPVIDIVDYSHDSENIDRNHHGWEDALPLVVYQPGFKLFMEAIDSKIVPTKEVEKETRILAWRSSNHRFKKGIIDGIRNWNSEAKENAKKLIDLLDASDDWEGVMRAELFRELERYEESLEQLELLDLPEDHRYASRIYQLAIQQNPNPARVDY